MDAVVPGSPSSMSSDNSDSDGVNTTSSKIYFGKFQTPEKKLAALVDSTVPSVQPSALNASTPGPSSLRRSPRLSNPTARQDAEESAVEQSEQEEDDEDERQDNLPENSGDETRSGSWQNAPFLEFLRKDEPSSALASRIMRAHDNPSPPPKSLRLSLSSRSSPKFVEPGVLPFIPGSGDSSDAIVESLLEFNDELRGSVTPPPIVTDTTPLPTPTMQRQSTRSPTPRPFHDGSSLQTAQADAEPDLISFDRSVLISPPAEVEIHSPSPQHAQQLTIDDLLFSSPPQPSAPSGETLDQGGSPTITPGTSLLPGFALTRSSPKQSLPADALNDAVERPGSSVSKRDVDTGSLTSDREDNDTVVVRDARQMTPRTQLPVPAASPSLRRSPRLSVLPETIPQATPRLSVPSKSSRPRTPKTEGYQGRKRRREVPGKVSRMSLTPRRSCWNAESEGSGSETELIQSHSKGKRDRKRFKKATDASSNDIDVRLAESLSPGSAHILSTLVSSENISSVAQSNEGDIPPSTPAKQEPVSSTEDQDMKSPTKPSIPPMSSNVQRPPPGTFRPFAHTPIRGNPARPHLAPPSPVKMTVAPASRDDPNRTPARRVPVKEVDNLTSSTRPNSARPAAPVFSRRPVFTRPQPDQKRTKTVLPPKQSIPPESMPKVFTTLPQNKPLSQASTSSRSRSVSVEPPEVKPNLDEQKAAEHAPIPYGVSSDTPSSSQPVFPEPSTNRVSPPPKPSVVNEPAKSTLKAESRIPRPGTSSKAPAAQKSKLPMPSAAKRPNGTASAPAPSRLQPPSKTPMSRVTQLSGNSASSSDESGSSQSGPVNSAPPRKALASALAKRKRDAEKPPQQMIRMRQVIPGMHGGIPKPPPTEKSPPAQEPEPEPIKSNVQRPIIRPRKVVKGTLGDFELKTASSKRLEAISEKLARERAEQERIKQEQEREFQKEQEQKRRKEQEQKLKKEQEQKLQKEPSPPAPSLETFTFECAVSNEQNGEQMDVDSATAPAPTTTLDSLPPSDDAPDVEMVSHPTQDPESEAGARRSTRARRGSTADVFGTATSTSTAQGQRNPRRKAPPSRPRGSTLPPNLLFSSNGLALKTLTNNNTARNQNYYVQLEMHVVRKAGEKRPESPTMKLRTVLEKQKEDQDKMRSERARRRRGESDASELGQQSADAQPSKHRRGPGEEEDYETPVRPNDGRKAVKWDRGLEVSVYLDEIEVHPKKYRTRAGVPVPRKGCLIPTPNRPLDELGNPLDVDAPLNVDPEKVVVTKCVYDNDEEAVLFDPPAAKNTRSKAKKK